jgi:stage II sporulation protein D
MKLHFVNIGILFCTLLCYAVPSFKKALFKDLCSQSVFSGERIPTTHRLAALWGTKKKLERWDQVVESIARATAYTLRPIAERAQERYTVRVLIDEHMPCIDQCSWELMSSNGFIVVAEDTQKTFFIAKPVIVVAHKKGGWYIDGKRIARAAVRMIPEEGAATVGGVTYQGDFLFTIYKDRVLCINGIELESYVSSVLNSESWPGWPLEVNKVFAIMSRSYVLSHMLSAQKAGRPYHVRNTNAHQHYHGVHTNTMLENAVMQTAGCCLTYDNKPILAMFDACCGGVIPAHIGHGIDFEKEPYLARPYACTYCKNYKLYKWQKNVTITQFEQYLRNAEICTGPISEVHVVSRDKAGLAKTVHIKSRCGVVACKGKQLYAALPEIKSYAFTITKHGNQVTLSGYGHGHHLGICQWGAREMVRLGYTYQQILSFYYPGTRLATIAS